MRSWDANGASAQFATAGFLDAMSAEQLALARHQRFHCGHCGGRVNLRVMSSRVVGVTGGERGYFAHAPGVRRDCPAVTGDALTVAQKNALFFAGRQEGARHRFLKDLLATTLQSDASYFDIGLEVHLAKDGSCRRPDVQATTAMGSLNIDIQLVPPDRETINGRWTFYGGGGLAHLWVLDGARLQDCDLPGFQDLIWRQGGQILAFDEEAAEQSELRGEVTMKLVTVSDQGDHIGHDLRWVGRAEVHDLAGLGDKTTLLAKDFAATAFFDHLASGDRGLLEAWYSAVLEPVFGLGWQSFRHDGLLALFGAVSTLACGTVRDGRGWQRSALASAVHSALITTAADRRHLWLPLIERAMQMTDTASLGPKTATMIERAKALADPEEYQRRLELWHPLLIRLMPGVFT